MSDIEKEKLSDNSYKVNWHLKAFKSDSTMAESLDQLLNAEFKEAFDEFDKVQIKCFHDL